MQQNETAYSWLTRGDLWPEIRPLATDCQKIKDNFFSFFDPPLDVGEGATETAKSEKRARSSQEIAREIFKSVFTEIQSSLAVQPKGLFTCATK